MKLRLLVLSGLLAFTALAADVTGKWTAEMQGRDGQMHTSTMDLKADGSTLTGTVSSPRGDAQISDGTVKGEQIAFNVVREFNGNSFKMAYTGVVSGDEIKFKVHREGGQGREIEFTAKRKTD